MYIPPWTILAGLGSMSREELCQLLPLFEDATLPNLAADTAKDVAAKLQRRDGVADSRAFQHRVATSADKLSTGDISDTALRLKLWDWLNRSYGLPSTAPLSARAANATAASLGHNAALTLASMAKDDLNAAAWSQLPTALLGRIRAQFITPKSDFSSAVVAQAQLLAQLIADTVGPTSPPGAADGHLAQEFAAKVREQLEAMPVELRDRATQEALRKGDGEVIKFLASGTSLVGLGVAVKMAGFSAYILAAQAAAFVPLVGGSTLVSGLFILSNPLFIGATLVGAAYLGSKGVTAGQKRLAANLIVQLALRGVVSERDGLASALDGFKALSTQDIAHLPPLRARRVAEAFEDVRIIVSKFDHSPGMPTGAIARREDRGDSALNLLFTRRADAVDAFVIGGLTLGDVLYDAVAIDPTVLRAADFSRTDDLGNVFDFGAFAHRASEMSADALAGLSNNLRGYVAEQIVATRLVEAGHVVSLPDTANNAGFDLLVDGHPFQVKCLAGIAGLREHFSKYPDLPVYANSELADAIAELAPEWARKVFFLDGFDRELTDLVMQVALDAGAQLHDFDVPFFAIAVSAARNAIGWWQGKMPLSDLPFSVVLDGAISGGLASVGGMSGHLVGLVVFGPAGALIFGGVGGAGALLAKGWTREQMTRTLSSAWLAELGFAVEQFRASLIHAIFAKIGMWKQKLAETDNVDGEEAAWFVARMRDELLSLAEQAVSLDKLMIAGNEVDAAQSCLRSMREASIHPLSVSKELDALVTTLAERPSLSEVAGRGVQTVSSFFTSRLRPSSGGK